MKRSRRKISVLIEALENRRLLAGGPLSVLDLLVVYTPAARDAAGGDAAIVQDIRQAVSDTNQAYANSQISLTMRLVHTEMVAYTESGNIETDLARLEGTSDGYMDSVHADRNTYGADLVSMFTNIVLGGGGGTTGLGDALLNLSYSDNDTQAFSVVGAAFAGAPDYTLAHETGHNLGGEHDREHASGSSLYPYSYGYRFTGNDSVLYHDIMSYDPGTTIPYFSNPNVLYQGVPTGVAIGQALPADLATTFAQTGPIVADYRPTVVPEAGPPTATVGPFTLSPDAHTLTFTVRYADDIAVDVSTLDSSDLVLSAGVFTSPVQFVSVDNPDDGSVRTATYRVTSSGLIPGGPYLLTIQANQVADTSGNFIAGGTTLGAPVPSLIANTITSEIGVHFNFTVTYTDDGAIRANTLDGNDIRVTGPNGFDYPATFISIDIATDGSPRTATYQIDSDYINGWNGSENGVYQVVMQSDQVADTAGNFVPAGAIGSFVVSIAGGSTASARNLGTLAGTESFNDAISTTDTLDYYKFTIAATSHFSLTLSGLSAATDLFLSYDVNNDGVLPPSEDIDFAVTSTSASMTPNLAPGVYYVIVQRDGAAVQNTSYTLALSANSDFAPPAATLNPATLTTAAPTFDFTVTYTDATAVLASSLGTGDVRVSGPGGFSQLAGFVSVDTAGDGTPRTVTYRLTPSLGNWSSAQNGNYTVSLLNGQVADTWNSTVSAQTLGTLTINIQETTPPTATLTPATLSTTAANLDFTVTYTDATAVLFSSLGTGDVQVTGPNSYSQQPVLVSVNTADNGSPRTATYRLTPPATNWSFGDNGAYTVSLVAGQVSDTLGNSVSAQTLGTLTVSIPDTSSPVATLNPATLTTPGAAFDFTVTYTDGTAVKYSTLGTGDLVVTGPNGFSRQPALASVNTPSNGSPRTATYRLTLAAGSWSYVNNGAYTVSLVAGQVSDTLNNAVTAQSLGTITVNIPETVPPTASLVSATLTTPAPAFDFEVMYSDTTAVLVSSLGTGDVMVTGPGFAQQAAFVSVDTPGNGSPRFATYRLTRTTGDWSFAQNGTYTVNLVAGQVFDTMNNSAAAQTLGTLTINIPDTTAPSASLTPATLLTGSAAFDFTVTYTDATAILASSLGSGDLLVTGPNGFSQQPSLVSVNTAGNGSPRTATYRLTTGGGNWSLDNNGTYTVTLVAGQVSDTLSNTADEQTLGTLTVNIAETTPPTALLNTVSLTTAAAAFDFTITYSDSTGVLASSIGTGDVQVTGPGGFSQQAALLAIDTPGDGSPRTATYRLTHAGDWTDANNGTYTVALVAGQVSDTLGNTAPAAALGTLTVNIPDTTPPAAVLAATTLGKAATSFNFIITYADTTAVLGSSLGTGAVLVTGPNGFSQQPTLVSVSSPGDGSPRAATYRLAAPGTSWSRANNGSYTVSLVAGQVADTVGNITAGGTVGTMTVSIPDTTPPRATLVTPAKVTRAGGTSYSFKVTYTDDTAVLGSSLGNGDIQIVGPRGFSQVAKYVSRAPATGNPAAVTVTYKFTPPGGKWDKADNGTYTIKLLGAQVQDTLKHIMPATTLGKLLVSV